MSIETKSMHMTPVGGNVFADLGFEPEEAEALKAESQRIISEKLAIKEEQFLRQVHKLEAQAKADAKRAQEKLESLLHARQREAERAL